MITERDIISALSGSLLSDFPAVIEEQDINEYANKIFASLIDIDSLGNVQNSLFHISPSSLNPQAVYDFQNQSINESIDYLTNYVESFLPSRSAINTALNLENIDYLSETDRKALLGFREEFARHLQYKFQVPVIFSNLLTD
jgi:hypothetical protein